MSWHNPRTRGIAWIRFLSFHAMIALFIYVIYYMYYHVGFYYIYLSLNQYLYDHLVMYPNYMREIRGQKTYRISTFAKQAFGYPVEEEKKKVPDLIIVQPKPFSYYDVTKDIIYGTGRVCGKVLTNQNVQVVLTIGLVIGIGIFVNAEAASAIATVAGVAKG